MGDGVNMFSSSENKLAAQNDIILNVPIHDNMLAKQQQQQQQQVVNPNQMIKTIPGDENLTVLGLNFQCKLMNFSAKRAPGNTRSNVELKG